MGPAGRLLPAVGAALALLCACSGPSDGPGVGSSTQSSAPGAAASEGGRVAPRVDPVGTVLHDALETPDGRTRTYRLYVPTTQGDAPVPLLVALHGGLGWADQFAETDRVEGLAEANGFLVVHPDGDRVRERLLSATWNGGYCCGPAAAQDVDDVAFLRALLVRIGTQYPVDESRVYAMGHSNGGIMSYRLACELGDRIVGIGVVGASLGVDDCAPPAPVSLIHIHGEADENHPIDGGQGERSLAGVDFHPAVDGVWALARVDGCPDEPSTTRDGDVTRSDWAPCDDGSAVAFVRIAGASHAWPGSAARSIAGPPYEDYDATAAIWAFLAAHPRR